ncbi:hypothetical protein C8R44DRAFT_294873 [Mycena epipterygia]|nr:hypothetical protein C8R44DRAFT_294873 [Mycena epipterygia]
MACGKAWRNADALRSADLLSAVSPGSPMRISEVSEDEELDASPLQGRGRKPSARIVILQKNRATSAGASDKAQGQSKAARGTATATTTTPPPAKPRTRKRTPGTTPAAAPNPKKQKKKPSPRKPKNAGQSSRDMLQQADQEIHGTAQPKAPRRVSFSDVPVTIPSPAQSRVSITTSPASQTGHSAQTSDAEEEPEEEMVSMPKKQFERLLRASATDSMAKLTARGAPSQASGTPIKMPGFKPNLSSQLPPRTFDIDNERVVSAHRNAVPLHIQKAMRESWRKQIPLSELTPAKCASSNEDRDTRGDKKVILDDDGGFIVREARRDKFADANLTPTEFITAGETLAYAVKEFFEPREIGQKLSRQLLVHFETIRRRADFEANFPRYKNYHVEVERAFLEKANFSWAIWQDDIWREVVEKDRDRVLRASIASAGARSESSKKSSFRNPSPSRNSFRNSFRPPSPAAPNKDSEGFTIVGKKPFDGRCMYCGSGNHVGPKCLEPKGRWCVRDARNRFVAPVPELQICWKYNSAGCDIPSNACRFRHACSLCGAGAKGPATSGHSAQKCTKC